MTDMIGSKRMFPAEPIPDTIGSYKIVRRLPATGVAEVYLAKAQGPMGFERECELKLMPDTSDGDRSYAEELGREAAICSRLNSPAVVRVFDFFAYQGKLVLALEHVEGTTLAELVQHLAEKHQKLGDQAIFHIGARIAAALADAHAAKDEQGNPTPIIHRNLNPETVLISVDGDVRLTGFGVGKILGRTPDTAIGRIKGTPGYMAPEQARGEPVTTKADVYGLGLLLWSLLAGKRPPTDGTWPRRISGVRTDLPREVAALVDAALDHFPGTRKITAREIEQWLSKAASGAKGKGELRDQVAALRAESKEPESPPPPSSRRRITTGSPYQGVRFGPPPTAAPPPPHSPPSSAPPSPATRVPSPSSAAIAPRTRARTATTTGVGKVVLNLPPPPAADTPKAPPAGPAQETKTLPSRNLVPDEDVEPISAIPISAAPAPVAAAPRPAPLPPTPAPPPAAPAPPQVPVLSPVPPQVQVAVQAPARPAGSTLAFSPVATLPPDAAGVRLAPVMPLAPPAAPPPVEPSSVGIRFGGAAQTATPAPTSVSFGAPPPVAPPMPPPPPVRRPLPSLLTIGPGRRSLSAMGAIVVSAITATLVVIVALVFFVRRDKPVSDVPSASAVAPPPPPHVTATAAPARPTATASAEPSPADLPYGYGLLTVVSPANANVFVSGKLAGPVNKPLKVRCGTWFVRLAAPSEGARFPEWVSPGETAIVPCQEATRLDMSPRRP